MTQPSKRVEEIAEQLHEWYLEATKELNPESYNPNAQKAYSELTEEQKFIDRFIAEKILTQLEQQAVEEERERMVIHIQRKGYDRQFAETFAGVNHKMELLDNHPNHD